MQLLLVAALMILWMGSGLFLEPALATMKETACQNPPGTYPLLVTDPAYTESTEDGLRILHKELFAVSNYGQSDGMVDNLYSGQRNTWTFTLPAPIASGELRIALVLDDHYSRPQSDYMGKISVNGNRVFNGQFSTLGVHHGTPYGGIFTNWAFVSFPFGLTLPSSSVKITVENNTCDNEGSFSGDWIAIDYIELAGLSPAGNQLLSLDDIDGDNHPELAVVTYDATQQHATAWIRTAHTGAFVGQVAFTGAFVPRTAQTVNDLNGTGAPEIAVLGVREADQAVQVEVRDSHSGARLSTVRFPTTWPPVDLAIIRNPQAGTAALAVLQQRGPAVRVQLKDATTGASLRTIAFTRGFQGVDLRSTGDLNGNQQPELVLLADHPLATHADQVEIRDSLTGERLRVINYGTGAPPQQVVSLVLRDPTGAPQEVVAVFRDGSSRVVVKAQQTGATVNTLHFGLAEPFKLVRLSERAGDTTLALLGLRARDGQTGELIQGMYFGAP